MPFRKWRWIASMWLVLRLSIGMGWRISSSKLKRPSVTLFMLTLATNEKLNFVNSGATVSVDMLKNENLGIQFAGVQDANSRGDPNADPPDTPRMMQVHSASGSQQFLAGSPMTTVDQAFRIGGLYWFAHVWYGKKDIEVGILDGCLWGIEELELQSLRMHNTGTNNAGFPQMLAPLFPARSLSAPMKHEREQCTVQQGSIGTGGDPANPCDAAPDGSSPPVSWSDVATPLTPVPTIAKELNQVHLSPLQQDGNLEINQGAVGMLPISYAEMLKRDIGFSPAETKQTPRIASPRPLIECAELEVSCGDPKTIKSEQALIVLPESVESIATSVYA
ncbi:hypothetical protein Nepgr_030924 [Nepenthes gracilis]|uniref:Uncharacterized protein n=1 Tax=Nepenthes gracilis TaxID=150966 RepID=A0AAD3TH51_NEPGR|nr:hypothetical protein Nepgr_030924 [Nepenthes gracilis]